MGRRKWTEEKIAQWEGEGRGRGKEARYQPWLEVADLSSKGRSRRVWSPKTSRVHHLFSDVEYHIFLLAEWSRSVVDIREQYPLEREVTQTIAHRLQIRHPTYPGTNVPTVMTVDFLLTVTKSTSEPNSVLALNAKVDEESEEARSIEKLEIQRSYFEDFEIEHQLIYRSRIPKMVANNLEWVRSAQLDPGECEPRPGYFDELKEAMAHDAPLLHGCQLADSLAQYCETFDTRRGLPRGTGLRTARMLIQERALMVNLEVPVIANEPMSTFVMTSRSGRLRSVGGV